MADAIDIAVELIDVPNLLCPTDLACLNIFAFDGRRRNRTSRISVAFIFLLGLFRHRVKNLSNLLLLEGRDIRIALEGKEVVSLGLGRGQIAELSSIEGSSNF